MLSALDNHIPMATCYVGVYMDMYWNGLSDKALGIAMESPDRSWGLSGSGYPTCVVESAVSESCRSLCRDAKIWLEHVDLHVTQVITIKIHRTRPEIVFTVW